MFNNWSCNIIWEIGNNFNVFNRLRHIGRARSACRVFQSQRRARGVQNLFFRGGGTERFHIPYARAAPYRYSGVSVLLFREKGFYQKPQEHYNGIPDTYRIGRALVRDRHSGQYLRPPDSALRTSFAASHRPHFGNIYEFRRVYDNISFG